jgi:hypothetical protein
MFGLDVAYFSFEKPPVEDMIPIADAHFIVDALVYCIDFASCREAVHGPDTEYKLRKEVEDYKALHTTRRLGTMSSADWEWAVTELKRRGIIKKKLRVVEGYKQTVQTEAKDPREFL